MFNCRRVAVCALVAGLLAACTPQERPQPLTPAAFAPAQRTEEPTPMDPLSRADQPGTLRETPPVQTVAPPRVEGISDTVLENVKSPGADGRDPTTGPTQPAVAATGPTTIGVSSGQYLHMGGLVMEVNGTAIYANKVIKMAEPVLAARAKELDQRQFRLFAMKEIGEQIAELRDLQLVYAAAERHLDQKDKDLADRLTMHWRQTQIN